MRNLVDAAELARVGKWARSTVYKWYEARKIPAYRFGRSVRFDVDEVLALMRQDSALATKSEEQK